MQASEQGKVIGVVYAKDWKGHAINIIYFTNKIVKWGLYPNMNINLHKCLLLTIGDVYVGGAKDHITE